MAFCGLLTPQVGVAALAAVLLTLSGAIIAANIFDYHIQRPWWPSTEDLWPTSLIFMCLFLLLIISAAVLMFASAYTDAKTPAIFAIVILTVATIYWVFLIFASIAGGRTINAACCIYYKCPESFWLANLAFRNYQEDGTYEVNYPDEHRIDQEEQQALKEKKHKDDKSASRFRTKRGLEREEIEETHLTTLSDITLKTTTSLKTTTIETTNESISILEEDGDNTSSESITLQIMKDTYDKLYFQVAEETTLETNLLSDFLWYDPDRTNNIIMNPSFFAAIFLGMINFLFLLFCIYTVYSWINYLTSCYEDYKDEAVTCVEDPVVMEEECCINGDYGYRNSKRNFDSM